MTKETWYTKARNIWGRKAEWIEGEGSYALLAWCRVLTVTLCRTRGEAEEKKKSIDEIGCGGFCTKKHEIIDLTVV